MKNLILYYSYHHMNTKKIAQKMAEAIKADISDVTEFDPVKAAGYDLIGFGSGIYHGKHHDKILGFVERLSGCEGKKAFIFSSSGMIRKDYHNSLRGSLEKKGFDILDEFFCLGYDTALDSKGINRWRPDEEDLREAERFAASLIK